VITKNWFIHKIKKNSQRVKKEVHIEDASKDLEKEFHTVSENYDVKREEEEFWSSLLTEMDEWAKEDLKENEVAVLNSIKILLENINMIDIFNKKAVYLYIREITGLNTKQVVSNLNRLRARYSIFKKRWRNGEI